MHSIRTSVGLLILAILLNALFGAQTVQATLIDRGLFDADGIPGGAMVRLIYDDDLNVTWLGDASFSQTSGFDADGKMNWNAANTWANGLTVGGFTDWRLPTADPSCGAGVVCMTSEMGHLFYDELGGVAGSSILTSLDPDLGLFSNLEAGFYWTGTAVPSTIPLPFTNYYSFRFDNGEQSGNGSSGLLSVWAVLDGDVPSQIPIPSTFLLFGLGFAGFAMWRERIVK